MKLRILTPMAKVYEGESSSLSLYNSGGKIGFLDNHTSFISDVVTGRVEFSVKGERTGYYIVGGVVRILQNEVLILADDVRNS